jgi:hypothetical protein
MLQAQAGNSASVDPEFGELLFERRHSRAVFGLVACLLPILAGYLFYEARGPKADLVLGCTFAGLCLVAALGFGWRWTRGEMVMSFYPGGVTRKYAGRTDRLPFELVTGISYALTRMYIHGSYVGTQLKLKLLCSRELGFRPFVFRGKHQEKLVSRGILRRSEFQGVDDLDHFRDHVSAIVATEMLDRIEVGEFVPWFGKVVLARDGVHVGGKLYTWNRMRVSEIKNGRFTLYAEGKFLSAAKCNVGVMNFFPGLMVLQNMVERASEMRVAA